MNLLILGIIVVCQLLFQALYFEKYYLNKKEVLLDENIKNFEQFLDKGKNKVELMEFIQSVKIRDNVALSLRDSNFSNRIGIENYMGNQHIKVNGNDNKKYNVFLGDHFINIDIKKNDYINVLGTTDKYGYVIAHKLFINGVEAPTYYDVIPNDIASETTIAQTVLPGSEIGSEIIINGYVDEFLKEDNSYVDLSNGDVCLSNEEKLKIFNSSSYNSTTTEDLMISSKKMGYGYIVATTALVEVNEVIGTMNSYYILIFGVIFILVIIISFIYSKFMTKPLVEMSKVAKRISECDFQCKYNVTSEDEIGVLGNSLNLISNNLEKSLSELQNTNIKLKDEMDTQRIQEDKRKELIANISHELKTPITIIQGSINGIKSGMYTTDMYEDILEESSKMNDLVTEMLEVSKLESPTFKLSKEPFDLYSIILKEQDKLKLMINEKTIEVSFYGEDEAIVIGDEKRINQVITNLLTNAIKYTPQNNKIELFLEFIENEEKYLFKIKNYGISLSKEDEEKVWDSFYRTEKSRNKKLGGTGLGLSIVKRILELHHSEYGVNSENNSVEFYFTMKKCREY